MKNGVIGNYDRTCRKANFEGIKRLFPYCRSHGQYLPTQVPDEIWVQRPSSGHAEDRFRQHPPQSVRLLHESFSPF